MILGGNSGKNCRNFSKIRAALHSASLDNNLSARLMKKAKGHPNGTTFTNSNKLI